jgi:hypothetical protein
MSKRTSKLNDVIASGSGEILLYGMTPPRQAMSPDAVQRFAEVTRGRLEQLDVDGLVLYDIDDESDRTDQQRPFPYSPTLDPSEFLIDHLTWWNGPAIVYRCVGKYAEDELASWLSQQKPGTGTVLVGASTRSKPVKTSLPRAYELWDSCNLDMPLGGVAIPERHRGRADEHLRLLSKQQKGCSFFVTQVIYDVGAAKDLVSDYAYLCRERRARPAPLVFTLSICGSLKTLDFLAWLGVGVPRWLQNELNHTDDPLAESYAHCLAVAREMATLCRHLGIPFGFNVESVSTRRIENDASARLVQQLRDLLN